MHIGRNGLAHAETGLKYHIIDTKASDREYISLCGIKTPVDVDEGLIGVNEDCEELCQTCQRIYKARKAGYET